MKLSYEDRILSNTSGWIHTNKLVWKVKGDKSGIVKAIHRLSEKGYLESEKEGNMIFYRRKDSIPSNESFLRLMEIEQWNYNQVLEEIKKIPKLSTKTRKISKRSKELVRHLEYLMDNSMILMVRTNYQKNLGLIPQKTAQRRIGIINEMMLKVMTKINAKYEKDLKLVQELFQNHNRELVFKI